VLHTISQTFDSVTEDNTMATDILVIVAIVVIAKVVHSFLFSRRCSEATVIVPPKGKIN
jgi:hypothetical protein